MPDWGAEYDLRASLLDGFGYSGSGQERVRALQGAMLRAGNFGSAAVAIPRSHPGGGAPPRPLARPFGSYWVVLRRGRGAGLGASLGRRSRAGSKREPNLQGSSVIYLQASSAGGRSFGIRSFRLRAHVAERICRWPSSAEVGIYVDDRHDCAEGQYYGILNLASVPLIRITRPSGDGQEGLFEEPRG